MRITSPVAIWRRLVARDQTISSTSSTRHGEFKSGHLLFTTREGQPTTRSVIVNLHNAAHHDQTRASCSRGALQLKSVNQSRCQPLPLPPLPRWQPTMHRDSGLASQTLTKESSRGTNSHSQPATTIPRSCGWTKRRQTASESTPVNDERVDAVANFGRTSKGATSEFISVNLP